MKIKKILSLILAMLLLISSMPIVFAAETNEEPKNYNLHKDLVFDYEEPVGDKAKQEFSKLLTNFSVEKEHTYVDNEGVAYTFSFSKGFVDLKGIMVPSNIEVYTLPATVTIYYFVADSLSSMTGSHITPKEGITISWDMPIGVTLCSRNIELNVIDTTLLGSVDAPTIVLSNRITMISDNAFNTDIGMGLKEIYAPSVEIIEKNAFLCCTNLTTVYMPKLRRVDANAFAECASLKNFTFESLQSIDKYAFSNCSSLKTVNLPKSVTYLNEGAFSGCTALEKVDIPAGIQINTLPKNCFLACTNLKEITLPYEIIVVSEAAFSGCANLSVINFINTNVSTINKNAFFGCLRLETAYLPQSLVSVLPNSFESCPSLRFVYFDSSLTDAQITSFDKAGFGEKIVTEKDENGPTVNLYDGNTMTEAPAEIVAPPTTLVVTDILDVVEVTVTLGDKQLPVNSRTTKVNSYATRVWDIQLKEDGEYKIIAIDAVGNKTTKTIKYTNSEIEITKEDVSVTFQDYYNELPAHPAVTIVKNGLTLKEGEHYTIEYKDADKVGNAQIIIKAISPCKGEIVIDYEIKELPVIIGDVNKDGRITATDARLVLRMSAMLEAYDEQIIPVADINGDGKISATDARIILRKAAMLE